MKGDFAPNPRPRSILAAARQAADAPQAELLDWRLESLAQSATRVNALRVTGNLTDKGRRLPFSVVLKRRRGRLEADREALAYSSGLLDRLRSEALGLIAPRCLAIEEHGPGERWLWLEDASETSGDVWSLDRYALAAYHLGRFNGAHPDEAACDLAKIAGLPTTLDYPWLGRGFLRNWVGFLEAEGIGQAAEDNTDFGRAAWNHPAVVGAFPRETRMRLRLLWQDREHLLTCLERLPRTLSHGDAHRRNLLSRYDPASPGGKATVAVDWDSIGLGPLGEDPSHLMSSSQIMGADPRQARGLDSAVFEAFMEGLSDSGWQIHSRLRAMCRFGYALHAPLNMAVFAGCGLVAAHSQPWLRAWLEALFDLPLEEAAGPLGELTQFTLNLFDEAVVLGERLGLL